MGKNSDRLILWDGGEKQIILSMDRIKHIGWHRNENGDIVDEYDKNLIEICYREDDEEGSGVGGDEFISTLDIKSMADCIRNVVGGKAEEASYSCLDDIIRIRLAYNQQSNSYTLTVGLIETLLRQYHINHHKERSFA